MSASHDDAFSPPPERGRSVRSSALLRVEADRVGVGSATHFDRTKFKTGLARRLRRASTSVEGCLWQKLRADQLGASFRRQHPAGRYILDFYCSALRLAVELDGGQHGEASAVARDKKRTDWLAENGVIVLRFWNSDVIENLSGVLETIAATVMDLKASGMTPTRRWRADLPLSGGGSDSPKR